jgi:hypothetical protein
MTIVISLSVSSVYQRRDGVSVSDGNNDYSTATVDIGGEDVRQQGNDQNTTK